MKRARDAAAPGSPPVAQATASPAAAPRWVLAAWGIALLAGIAPLWLARDLPMVDLPQHLYLLDVMNRIADASTLYPTVFASHFRFTPYLGYYAVVGTLGRILPLEVANRVFLSLATAALPLATALLLRALRRPTWPALLAIPLAYGDCFGWGFVNTLAAQPLALLSLAAAILATEQPGARVRWSTLLAAALVAGFLMHPAPTLFLGLAVPVALFTTAAPDDATGQGALAWFRRRAPIFAAAIPLLVVVAVWLIAAARDPVAVAPGAPRAAWGPMFSAQNLQWESPAANLRAFPWLLANLFNNGLDQLGLRAVALVVVAALASRFFESAAPSRMEIAARLGPLLLVGIAFTLFMALPLSIQGVIQYLSPRFAPLTAVLAVTLVPRTGPRSARWMTAAAVCAAVLATTVLTLGFRAFSVEAAALRRLAPATAPRARIAGLVFEPHSHVVHHPVYLHAAAVLARLRGGLPSYTLADWRQVSLRYRGAPPRAPPSEWRPDLFDYATMGPAYDHFLVRGASPDSVFGSRLGSELEVAAHEGDWWLLRRAAGSGRAH